MRMYCYKVKHPYLKVKENNAYAHAKIEEYGFSPMFEQFDEGISSWIGGWAKTIKIKHNSRIGEYLKRNIENIYKSEMAKCKPEEGSRWVEEIRKSGYEFDDNGKLIDNEASTSDTDAQLCVMLDGIFHGTLFINVGGVMEIYDHETLLDCAEEDIKKLLSEEVIYKARLYMHEDA